MDMPVEIKKQVKMKLNSVRKNKGLGSTGCGVSRPYFSFLFIHFGNELLVLFHYAIMSEIN